VTYLAICHVLTLSTVGQSGTGFRRRDELMRYLLGARKTLIVRGPASIRLLTGKATALGAPLENRSIIIRQERQLPIETSDEASLGILTRKLGSVFEVEGSTIPGSWHSALEALVEMKQGRVVIIGATDVGKSTISAFLVNGLLSNGVDSRIVDADIGQADIGPPTTIGSASPSAYISSLVELKPSALFFIGHISPGSVQSKLFDAVRRLASESQRSLTIINTDGWVSDPEATAYKAELIETIQPDLVLAIAAGTELESIISRISSASMRIEAPTTILTRSRSDRREIRTAAYRRFLDGGRTRAYSLRENRVKMPSGLRLTRFAGISEPRNLLVGLLDKEGFLLQIGVLLGLEKELVRVYSRSADLLKEIEFGYVKLTTDGVELGYVEF
jgi:polynucleotide 5'-kinase involved in rRNA processing